MAGRIRNKEQTRANIVKAASVSLRKDGYEATTIRSIAKRCKIGVGTVHSHFKSKDDLAFTVLASDIDQIMETALAAGAHEKSLNDQLLTFCKTVFALFADHPDLYSTLLAKTLLDTSHWQPVFEQQVHDTALRFAVWFREAGYEDPAQLQGAVLTFVSSYYFVLMGQIKSTFSDTESGLQQIALMLNSQRASR